jgi:uncharacterized protein (TIGR02284 family)
MVNAGTQETVVSTLNNLIETCKDGQEGFKTAAEGIKDNQLRTLFLNYSQERAQICQDLSQLVQRLGGTPEKTGHVGAALHRGWMNIKQAVTGNDPKAVIDEAERGEDVAVQNFQKALQENLPQDVRTVIEREFILVKQAHDRISALKHSGATTQARPTA